MFYVKQSESTAARRRVPILMVDATDGSTPETGLTLYGLLSKNGNTFAATAGTFAEAGYGQYYYQFDTGEIDTLGFAGIHVTASGARNYDAIIHITAYDAYVGSFIAPTDVWNADISSITSAGTAGSQLNLVASGGAGITSGDVWNYDISGITGAGTAGSQVNAAATGGAGITAGDVWEYDISGIVTAGTSGSQLNTAASVIGGSLTAADVWDYNGTTAIPSVKETLEFIYFNTGNIPSADTVRDAVWNAQLNESAGFATSPPYASGLMYQAGNAITTVPSDVWNYDISAISGAGLAGTQLNLAAFGTTSNAPSEVWSYVTREITGGTATTVTNAVLVDPASMTGIAGTVWSTDVSAFTNPSAGYDLTQAASGGITAGDVWSYALPNFDAGTTLDLAYLNGTPSYVLASVWGADPLNFDPGTSGALLSQAASGATTAAEQVWNYDISAISTAGTAGSQLNLAAAPSGAGITAGDVSNAVWDVPVASYTTNGTFGLNILRSDIAGVAGTVTLWTGGSYSGIYADTYRIDASYNAAIALKDILTGIGASITGNITGDLSGSVGSVTADVNVSTASMSGIANTVWSTDVSGYTSPSAGFDLANASAGGGITAGAVADAVWTAQVATYATAGSNETLGTDTYGQKIARTVNINRPISINTANAVVVGSMSNGSITATAIASNAITEAKFATDAITSRVIASDAITSAELAPSANTEIADAVWAYATRIITGGTMTTNNDKTGYSLSSTQTFDLTGNITGDLSGSVGSVATGVTVTTNNDKTGYSLSSTQSFNLTGNITGSLSGSVGSVSGAVSSVTNPITVSTGSMTGIAGTVWSVATRTITGGTATTVTNAVVVDPASMVGIAGTVWSTDISSYPNPSAGYSLAVAGSGGVSAADVWQYATRGLTEDVNVSTTSMSGIANTVWSVGTRTITGGIVTSVGDKTGYSLSSTQTFDLTGNITGSVSGSVGSVTGSVGSVVNPVLVATASMSGIAGTVWTYTPRTLTSGAGATAGDIWTYNISGIATTGTAGATLNSAAVAGSVVTVVNGPYRLTSTAEGVDGRIDILADSVQTIQLSCLDGLGAPFNIGGYTSLVNVYDVSGALAATYTPTVDFAQNGILSFEIDADITGVTGRYTLVVELTAGAEVIQLGPLEILVRPL
jgi:hypothetical protein